MLNRHADSDVQPACRWIFLRRETALDPAFGIVLLFARDMFLLHVRRVSCLLGAVADGHADTDLSEEL